MSHFRSATLFEGSADAKATCPRCDRQFRPVGTSSTGSTREGRGFRHYYLPAHGPRNARCTVGEIIIYSDTGEIESGVDFARRFLT